MKILLCLDKFKGSLSAEKVCKAIESGLKSVGGFEIKVHPLADGGDGSIEILKSVIDLNVIKMETVNPLGKKIIAEYYHSTDTAFIELASASGLVLLSEEERNPMYTSTKGTGVLVKDALQRGFKRVYLFLGGSSTNDGGIGIADELGFDFLSSNGSKLDPIGKNLEKIEKIVDNELFDFSEIEINVLCDVENPMFGSNGAAYVYAKQKGANKEEIILLDNGLKKYGAVLNMIHTSYVTKLAGIGAAGATGASVVGLLGGKLAKGFQMISELTGLEKSIEEVDLVITGEGKVDKTSFQGKVVGNVDKICRKFQKRCGIVGGIIENENKKSFEFQKAIINYAQNKEDAIQNPEQYLFQIGKEIGQELS